jgi:F-box/WD-40 domain protein 7
MTYSTQMNDIIEERYQFCIWLYRIKKETDKRNKAKRERGEEDLVYVDIFAKPCHIKKLFGDFLKTPQYTHIHNFENHTTTSSLTIHENKLYCRCIEHVSEYSNGWGGGHGSCRINGSISIWNTYTDEEIKILRHTQSVECLTLHENKLYSGSDDETIRVWNTKTYEEITTLRGHTDTVCCLTLHENKLYSGGYDKTIRIWNTETYEEIVTFEHTQAVFSFTLHENKLYSIDRDNTIRIWNTETYEKIVTVKGYSFTIHENKLYIGDWKFIRVWDIETYEEIATFGRRGMWNVNYLAIHENKLYSGSYRFDTTIRIWNTETYEAIATLEGHTEGVKCLTLHENKLYSCGNDRFDNTIRVWKIDNNPNFIKRKLEHLKTSERGDRKRLSEGERKEVDDDYVLQSDEEWATDEEDS